MSTQNPVLDQLVTEIAVLSQLATSVRDAIANLVADQQPIPDTSFRVPSRSRSYDSHLITQHNGVVRCSCESATFRPDRGKCAHVVDAIDAGRIDARAEWGGGLFGLNA